MRGRSFHASGFTKAEDGKLVGTCVTHQVSPHCPEQLEYEYHSVDQYCMTSWTSRYVNGSEAWNRVWVMKSTISSSWLTLSLFGLDTSSSSAALLVLLCTMESCWTDSSFDHSTRWCWARTWPSRTWSRWTPSTTTRSSGSETTTRKAWSSHFRSSFGNTQLFCLFSFCGSTVLL